MSETLANVAELNSDPVAVPGDGPRRTDELIEEPCRTTPELYQRLDYVFSKPGVLLAELRKAGYITDPPTAFTVWNAYRRHRPILQEGPAGAGKTQLALSVAEVTGMRVIRLQCYPGITDDKAIGHYNEALQRIFSQILSSKEASIEEINRQISSRKFFITGPLLDSIECEDPCVLLIDEVDKVSEDFESMLLELLSAWELSAPGLGTIKAKSIPLTFVTSNAVRDLGNPLRRRSYYIEVKHPTPELEARIVAYKTQSLPIETHVFIAGMALALRSYTMLKHPSISEMTDIAASMKLMELKTITPEQQEVFLPLLAKRKEDLRALRISDKFASIVSQANDFVLHVKLKVAESRGLVGPEITQISVDRVVEKLKNTPELREMRGIIEAIEFTTFPDNEMKRIGSEKAEFELTKKGGNKLG